MTVTTMHHCARPPRPSGFALIEALIAVVVLATGLLALTALQGALTRSSADSKARSQVAAYVASEMDRIRTGESVAAKSATTTGTNPISVAARAAGLSSLSQTVTSQTFYADAAGSFDTLNPNTGKNARFERIRLNMAWTDATGAGRGLSMTTDMSPLALVSSKVLVDREPLDPNQLRPIVRRASPVTEGMIPIAMGDGQDTAATNPKPELVGRKDDTLVSDTRFDVLTYALGDGTSSSSDFARFNKKIETALVGCKCQTGKTGFPTGGNAPEINSLLVAQAYRPSYFDGTAYTEPAVSGAVVSSPDTSATQSELCDVCCRDHRDPAGTAAPLYAPQLATHDHYLDLKPEPDTASSVVVTSGKYYEACRVIRTNGVWRVTPDPVAQDIALLATKEAPPSGSTTPPNDNTSAISPLVADSAKTNYVTYAYDFIKTFFYDKFTTFDRYAMQRKDGLDVPEYVPIKSGETRWLHARSFLIDKLEADAVERIQKAIDECTGTSDAALAQCVLPYTPVAAVNVTELADWSGQATSDTGIVLSGSLATSTVNYAQARLRRYVSQLAVVPAINPTDGTNPAKDEQTFALVPPATDSGAWLTMPNTAGTIFGDATKPIRGYATYLSLPTKFSVVLNGIPAIRDPQVGSPLVSVGSADCSSNSLSNANPYGCTSPTSTGLTLGFNSYNRTAIGGNTKICNTPQKKRICLTYTYNGLTVDGVSKTATYTVVSGGGTRSETSTLSPIAVLAPATTGYPSTVQVSFTETSKDASYTCPVSGTGTATWSCP